MLKAISKFFGAGQEQPAEAPAAPASVPGDGRTAAGARVYHEFFVDEKADGHHWLCRVYAGRAINEQTGVAQTDQLARNAALTWAARTKAALRGES